MPNNARWRYIIHIERSATNEKVWCIADRESMVQAGSNEPRDYVVHRCVYLDEAKEWVERYEQLEGYAKL